MNDKKQDLSQMLLKDLEEFEEEANRMDIETAELAKVEDMKLEEGDEMMGPDSFIDYERKDFVAQEREKLLDSELYKSSMRFIEEDASCNNNTSASTFELVVKSNQLIVRIDQM